MVAVDGRHTQAPKQQPGIERRWLIDDNIRSQQRIASWLSQLELKVCQPEPRSHVGTPATAKISRNAFCGQTSQPPQKTSQ
jgi:hypothetical protein